MSAITEMRACIGIDAARRCAERAPAAMREEAARRAEAAAVTHRARGAHAGEHGLWAQLVAGAGNLAYRLALNTLVEGVATFPELDARLNAPRDDAATTPRSRRGLRSGDGG